MNRFNLRLKIYYASSVLKFFMQNVGQLAPPIKPCMILESHTCLVMMGKFSLVHSRTQGLFPLVADGNMFVDYCKNCFYPAVDEE
jgi:hypothetical protein